MSLFSSLQTSVSGLRAYGDSIQVIGNNIANVSTVGYKSSRAEFADLLSQSISGAGGTSQLGLGVRLDGVTRTFSQGSLNSTDRLTDLGIDGGGFFIVNDGAETFYTRNGRFNLNAEGYLVNSEQMRVQGNLFDLDGNTLGVGDLRLNQVTAPPRPTSDGTTGPGVVINANLDSRSAVIPGGFVATGATAASQSSNFSTTITTYDSLGNSHATTVYFTKTQDATATQNAQWSWNATVDGAEVTGGTAGQLIVGANGTLEFDLEGRLVTETTNAAANFDFVGASPDQVVAFDFGDAITAGGTGLNGTTQYASESNVLTQTQDGYGAGSLSSIAIDPDGTINGFFTNGESVRIAQILLADFANPQGLVSEGNGLFAATAAAGAPIVGTAGTGQFGNVNAFTLELSNVDLANEFVSLVTNQRAYQANSRIISTVDQLLADVVSILR